MTRKNSEKSKASKGVYARTSATFKKLYYNVLVNMKIRNKLLLSFIMILGRLEIFTLLLLFSPSVWRKQ